MVKLTQQEAASVLMLLMQAKHDRHPWDNVTSVITGLQQKIQDAQAEEEPPPPEDILKKVMPKRTRKR